MKTYIVLIPVDNSLCSPRNACEQIENTIFQNSENALDVRKKVMFELGIETDHNIEVEPITDFMERVNNEEFNPDNYFLSYVYVNETTPQRTKEYTDALQRCDKSTLRYMRNHLQSSIDDPTNTNTILEAFRQISDRMTPSLTTIAEVEFNVFGD